MDLDKESPIPLLVQLKEEIEQSVLKGEYKSKIPSERELMRQYDVSRSTVREAINSLVSEGVLVKEHGKGTFVSIKPLHDWLGQLSSTTDMIHSLGMAPGAKLIEFERVTPPQDIQEMMQAKQAYFLKRLRLADNQPLGIEQLYYPVEIGEQLLHYELDKITMYDVIQNDLGITFVDAKQKINLGYVSKTNADYLNVEEGACVLHAERVIQSVDERVVEYEEAFYLGDKFAFEINLARKFG